MNDNFLSSFTPSLMPPATLEAIFVQRQKLVADLIESVRHSAETANKHFRLLIGMRGIGKTHTIALIYHRLKALADLEDKLLIAWLEEDELVNSWLDLLLKIIENLQDKYPQNYQEKQLPPMDLLYELSADDSTYQAERILKELIGNKTLLLLIENLDEIFKGLGNLGQKQFRAYLQNHNLITIIATSQSLFAGVSKKDSPFYGFFNTKPLEKLTIEEATALLKKIAELQQNKELESFINSPTGKNRVKAIHHLAGGNHRVYIIFSQFLTRNSLDELVKPLLHTLDELTPYYQAKMSSLSLQQRKIIKLICDKGNALAVKKIAQRCFITHQTASSQLKDLRTKGYVTSESVGRESFYELQEPLMRICLEVKKQRGEPIKLFIDFLRIWYTKEELEDRLNLLPADCLEREYIHHALAMKENYLSNEDELVNKGIEEEKKGNLEKALELFDEAIKNNDNNFIAWGKRGVVLGKLGRYEDVITSCKRAIEIKDDYYNAWVISGMALSQLGRYEEALISYDKAVEINPHNDSVWHYRGRVFDELERYKEALASYSKAIEINPHNDSVLDSCGITLDKLGEYEEALVSYNKAIEINPHNDSAWHNRSITLLNLKKYEEVITSCDQAIKIDPKTDHALYVRGNALYELGKYEEAVASYDQAIDINPDHYYTWNNRGVVLYELERYEEAVASYEKAKTINPVHHYAWNNLGNALYELGRYKEAIASYEKVIIMNSDDRNAWGNSIKAIFKLNNWETGFKTLEDKLNKLWRTRYLNEYVEIIWNSTTDINLWKSRLKTLVKIYDEHLVISALSKGIVDNIPSLMSEIVSDKLARSWLEIWQSIAGEKAELSIALRLLKTAVEYKETKGDRRVLLQLAKEEREILEPLVT